MVNAARQDADELRESTIMKIFNEWQDKLDPSLSDTSFLTRPESTDDSPIKKEYAANRIQHVFHRYMTKKGGSSVDVSLTKMIERRLIMLRMELAYDFWCTAHFDETQKNGAKAAEIMRNVNGLSRSAFGHVMTSHGFRIEEKNLLADLPAAQFGS